jgi:hypothetical protein
MLFHCCYEHASVCTADTHRMVVMYRERETNARVKMHVRVLLSSSLPTDNLHYCLTVAGEGGRQEGGVEGPLQQESGTAKGGWSRK